MNLGNFNLNLDDRQKRVLMVAGAAAALLLLLWTVVLPRLGFGGLGARIEARQRDLREMLRLYQDFEQVKREVTRDEAAIRGNKNVSLLSELTTLAEKVGVKQGIESMVSKAKPKNDFFQEESVELRLQKINTEELTRLLYEIEQSPKVLRVRKLHVETRFDDATLVNVTMEVSMFKMLTD